MDRRVQLYPPPEGESVPGLPNGAKGSGSGAGSGAGGGVTTGAGAGRRRATVFRFAGALRAGAFFLAAAFFLAFLARTGARRAAFFLVRAADFSARLAFDLVLPFAFLFGLADRFFVALAMR
jgi:hypothetical protein